MFGTSTQVKFAENLKEQIDHVTTPLMKDTFHELSVLIQPRFSFTLYGTFCLYKVKNANVILHKTISDDVEHNAWTDDVSANMSSTCDQMPSFADGFIPRTWHINW